MRKIEADEAKKAEDHRKKEAEAAKCVAVEAPDATWKPVPIEAFEPTNHDCDDARDALTPEQKDALTKCNPKASSAGQMR
jgi:hypothetical protein